MKQNHPLLYSPDDDKKLSLSLGSLHNHLFPNESFTGHDSIEDIKAMECILFHPELGITESIIRDNTFLNKKQNVMEWRRLARAYSSYSIIIIIEVLLLSS